MREFQTDGKVNFVDKNDVLVGFDTYESCCENFGWFYSPEPPTSIDYGLSRPPEDIESYIFDTNFFQETYDEAVVYQGGMVTFKLINAQKALYLSLFNSHNGYYSHGFQVTVAGKNLSEGSL